MKSIAELDPNFRIPEEMPQDLVFYPAWEEPFSVWGLAPNRPGVFCRLPESFLPECSPGVQELAWHLAGGCVRFTTDAERIGILFTLRDTGNMPHFTACGQSGLELFEETDEGPRQIKTVLPLMQDGHGCRKEQARSFALPGGRRHYCLVLPLYNGLERLLIGLPGEAVLEAGRAPRVQEPIVFYGSSITQGGCASKPGSCYSNILARRLDANTVNLGFSGNGKGEENMARYIASLGMSAFVLDYDNNAPDEAHLAATHARFFSIVREAQPELPVLILSKPDFDVDPEISARRRAIVRATWEEAVRRGDRHVWFVDGEEFFGDKDRDLCTVDGSHPTDIGFLRMADRLEPLLREALFGRGKT